MGFEEAFQAADSAVRTVRADGLRDIERVVLEGSWNRHTYQQIASDAGYTEGYLSRDVGPALWGVLSDALGMQVKKTNFRTAIERWSKQASDSKSNGAVGGDPDSNGHRPDVVAVTEADDGDPLPIDVSDFRGHDTALADLASWITDERGRLLCLSGMPGVGKTWFAVKLAQELESQCQRFIYRSLSDRPTPLTLVTGLLHRLQMPLAADASLQDALELLVKALDQRSSLIVLDDIEALYQHDALVGTYHADLDDYSQLLETLAGRDHRSCVFWVGREHPRATAYMASSSCRFYTVEGLSTDELPQLVAWPAELQATETGWQTLLEAYGGVPVLVLTEVVPRLSSFGDNLDACLQALAQDNQSLQPYLSSWLAPLSEAEWTLLDWLMICHRPLSLAELNEWLGTPISLSVLESLCDRGVCRSIVNGEPRWGLMFPDLLGAYLRDRFLTTFAGADESEQIAMLHRYPLVQARAPEMVRQWQKEYLLDTVTATLSETHIQLSDRQAFLERAFASSQQLIARNGTMTYGGGNLVNLAQNWQISLVDVDFQGLWLREADLQSDYFQGVCFSGADLSHTLLAKPLGQCPVIAMSPTWHQVAVGDQDGRLLLWNIDDGRLQQAMLTLPDAVRALAFSQDGLMLAESRQDGTVRLWDLQSEYGPELFSTGTVGTVTTLVFSLDKQLLVGGDDTGHLYVWRLASGEELHRIDAHEAAIVTIAIDPYSRRVITCGQDCAAIEWDLQTGAVLHRFQGRLTNQLGTVAYLPGQADTGTQSVVAGRDDGQIVLWDIASARPLRVMNEPCDMFMALALSPNGRYLAASDVSNTVSIWDVERRSRLHQISQFRAPIESLLFSVDSQELIAGCDYAVQLWQVRSGQCLRSWRSDRHPANKLALAANPLQLLSSHDDQTVRCWQFSRERNRWLPHSRLPIPGDSPANVVATSPCGDYWVVGTETGLIHVWHRHRQQWLDGAMRLPSSVTVLAFSNNSELLAAGDAVGTVALWNLSDRTFRWQKTNTHADQVMSLTFVPDGQRLFSGSRDRVIQGWDYNGNQIATFNEHRRRVHTLCASVDGQTLYSGSQDGTIRRWDLSAQTDSVVWQRDDLLIQEVTLDSQNRPVAIVSDTQTLEIWELEQDTCRSRLTPHRETVWHVSTSPDGQALVCADQTGNISIWSLTSHDQQGYLRVDRPYEGMHIGGCQGLTDSEQQMLHSLGATDY